ncbi:DUF6602 domain-containing protein [Sorangium sp. So ce128]|uniref:DUF6602 domain-containing protein n=1 Tax=Sorangium sp. So ce128 TaxID=3133281 RepID=UPI003F6440AF
MADLLSEVLRHQSARLDKQNVKHASTIGEMYEGLTGDELSRLLPAGVGLSVASGFVQDCNGGGQSGQIDCMVVVGEGETLPYSRGKKIYPVEQVIAVIEVKKHIKTAEIASAHDLLAGVVTLRSAKGVPFRTERLAVLFEEVTGMKYPRTLATCSSDQFMTYVSCVLEKALPDIFCKLPEDIEAIPPELFAVYCQLVIDEAQPVRILLGYHGATTERALRKMIYKHVSGLSGRLGYAPATFPHVIASPQAAAIKAVGGPWIGRYDDGRWDLILTSDKNSPIRAMINAIWFRLYVLGLIDEKVFSEEETTENWNALFSFRYVRERHGWLPMHWETPPPQHVP